MRDRKSFEKVEKEIIQTGKALLEYEGYKDAESINYNRGWNEAIEQFVLELLGRKEQDGAQLLIQAVNNLPSSSKELTCDFCSNKAFDKTPGNDKVCIKCGDEIIENVKK